MKIVPKIQNGNSKLGTSVGCVNLPAGVTCRPDAPCSAGCYAKKGRFVFQNVKNCAEENYKKYLEDPVEYFDVIKSQLKLIPYQFFRWHSSGDIVDMGYFNGMVSLAREVTRTRFLCFTKKFEIVNEWISKNGSLPENLIVVLSTWGEWKPDNPYNLPTSYVRFSGDDILPEDGIICNNYCGDCCAEEKGCWYLSYGKSVIFNKH